MPKPLSAHPKNRIWVKARTAAFLRDEYQCQAHKLGLCDKPCQAPKRKLTVHHIKWRIHGGTHDLDNLITLCYEHHAVIHPFMDKIKPMKPRKSAALPFKKSYPLPLKKAGST